MADEAGITITGIEEVCAALDTVPGRVAKHCYAKALAAASVPIAEALLARCPVDTGDLKKHLVTDIQVEAEGMGGRAQVGFGKAGYKARFVEYGHREVAHKDVQAGSGIEELGVVQPHPFMRPAASASADAAIEAFTESMIASLQDEI